MGTRVSKWTRKLEGQGGDIHLENSVFSVR